MAEILKYEGLTTLSEPAESVLEKAKGWGMDRCVIIGYRQDGSLAFGGNHAEAPEILMLLELAKKWLLENNFAREN